LGISAILGPLAGGWIVRVYGWAWICWRNIPLGIVGISGVSLFLHEKVEKEERAIDYAGSGFFCIAVSSLMVLFIEGGTEWEWLSGPTFILLTVSMIGMAAFLWREKKAFSPMMPLRLWQDKLVALANIATFTSGAIMIGLSSF